MLLAVAGSGRADPPLPQIPTNQFYVTNFGAVGNGVSNSASAIQSAINAAGAAGGGTVIVAAAGALTNYLSGPITLANRVSLQINSGTMLQMLSMSNWPSASTPFINGSHLHNVEINGSGTIDGQGTNWWLAFSANTNLVRPVMITIGESTQVLVQAVTLQNPPKSHFELEDGNVGVTVQGITINTPSPSPNTDGIDLGATNCLIRNCFISDGDDNIALKPSSAVSADIVISNCTFGTGHGVSIGSGTTGGLHNMTVSNCSFNGTVFGIRMKSDRDRGGLVQNLKYMDITMTNVEYPIVIYSYYDSVGTPYNITPYQASTDTVHAITSTTPIWRNIIISNVTATALTGSHIAGILWGLPEMLISNVTLDDVNFSDPTKTFCVYNAQGIQILDSNLTAPNTTTNTLTLYNAQVTVTNSAPNTNLVMLTGLDIPPTNNALAFFNAQAAITATNVLGPDPFLTLGGSTLTMNNNLNLGGTSILDLALGTNATEIAVTGNLTLGGALNISDGGGFTDTTYKLFTYGGTLTYNTVTVNSTPNPNFTYTISTNTVRQVNLVVASPAPPPQDPFVAWALKYFGCTNDGTLCTQAAPNADPYGKGISNTNQFLVGLDPTNPASQFRITSVAPQQGTNMVITWTTAGGHTNMVQVTDGDATGGYTNNFTDIPSSQTILPGSGDTATNFVDSGGATNVPSRYYHVRLVP